jgi:hypothetical protein
MPGPQKTPTARSSPLASRPRWGWTIDPRSQLTAEELERRPPQPVPGEDYGLAHTRWRLEIEAAPSTPALVWNSYGPTQPYSSAAVFGGTIVGWHSFVVTLGASTLDTGAALTVINLSERPVTDTLARVAMESGYDVRLDRVAPGETTVDLLAYGGSGDRLVDFILDVLHPEGGVDSERELRDDKALLRTVAELLEDELTARRLRAALRVILRESELEGDDRHLTAEERTVLGTRFGKERLERTDLIERAARLAEELREFVAIEESASRLQEPTAGAARLRIIEVARTATHYDLQSSRRILVESVLRRLRSRAREGSPAEEFLILGADAMRTGALDAIVDLAQTNGGRATLVFAHLREDAINALGAAGAAVAFMRLTDPREAATASGYIGKDEKMVLAQATLSRSENYARQAGTNTSSSSGESWSVGLGGGSIGRSGALTAGTQHSVTLGKTMTTSSTDQRVIEELIQPTVLQGLAETGLLVVNLVDRTAVFADCDPTIAAIDG